METEQIIRLVQAVSASNLTAVEYQEGEVKLVLKSEKEKNNIKCAADILEYEAKSPEMREDCWIQSPLVGTFYRAPQEDAAPYVAVGDKVSKGQIVGIIETMKLMNELECDRDGVIAEIMVENEQVVEFGQKLFRIE